ncbi:MULTISPECIES: STAS domain-containing protein [Streptomyces]|uniref:STAS domain-containing protein n=1 Tax=Streptomyces doudnae TaxID=3075536 RepID=A0ABD5ESE5_9ACTN|nr:MULTISPECIES: STAS domain-containing protein [unclassified Streptomyces]MDT0437265.1 STAS domain-containing protein [Streptomyces sp. DSM 41981]MYQ67402.1 STAS domain-containing protein [Streptomyces sp. SID4950]SCE34357.1 anti-anti-sigma factor [Streptomyces sp. SolWspMP-5a-2]
MTHPHPSSFGLTVERGPDAVQVRVDGDLDFDNHDELTALVTWLFTPGAAAEPPPRWLRLDLAGLRCIDSSGLSALLQIRRSADRLGARLTLEKRPTCVDRLLDLTGTHEYLTAPVRKSGDQERPGTG